MGIGKHKSVKLFYTEGLTELGVRQWFTYDDATGQRIDVGSPQWAPLRASCDSFTFPTLPFMGSEIGVTVGKRTRKGRSRYWYGYAKHGGKVKSIYLGTTEAIESDILSWALAEFSGLATSGRFPGRDKPGKQRSGGSDSSSKGPGDGGRAGTSGESSSSGKGGNRGAGTGGRAGSDSGASGGRKGKGQSRKGRAGPDGDNKNAGGGSSSGSASGGAGDQSRKGGGSAGPDYTEARRYFYRLVKGGMTHKAAYRKASLEYHPDRPGNLSNGDPGYMKVLNDTYDYYRKQERGGK